MRTRTALVLAVVAVIVGAAALVSVWRGGGPGLTSASGPPTVSPTVSPTGASTGAPTVRPSSSCPACLSPARLAAATARVKAAPGHIGIVVRDRVTGTVWRAGEPSFRIWAGSIPKLALAVALREENRSGQIKLDAKANSQIAAMLSISDNNAADALWDRYVNASALMKRMRDVYGMKTAGYVTGFPSRWGFVKCTAEDLANLMAYVLRSPDRDFFVAAMRSVGPVQHWGVWGAGAAQRPGVKDGWSIESDAGKDHWITATVGFAGPGERYIVAAMYHQFPGGDSIERGVHTLTDLVATIFGAPVPAPAEIPRDY